MSATLVSAVLNGAIVSFGLLAILSLAFRFFGNRVWNASTRYAVWFVALVMTAGLPLAYAIHSLQPFAWASEDESNPNAVGLPSLSGLPEITGQRAQLSTTPERKGDLKQSAPGNFSVVTVPAGPWTSWLLAAWAITSAALLIRLSVGYFWLHRRKARALPPPDGIRAGDWLKRCGSSRRIRVAASAEIAAPMAAGPFQPLILIPTPLFQRLQHDELEQIGLHEAAHFARLDDYALLFQRVCEAVFAFHPAVRWIAARMDVEREIACDDFVVEVTGRPRPYAECLTRVAAFAGGHVAPSLAAPAVETRSVLERRLDMLLDKNRKPAPHLLKAPLAALLALSVAVVWTVLAGPQWVVFATSRGQEPAQPAGGALTINQAGTAFVAVPAPANARAIAASPAPAAQTPGAVNEEARDSLNRGVRAFRAGDFQSAVDYFGRASQLDPEMTVAKLYLATTYASMVVPGPQGQGTADFAYRALRTFEDVLSKEPGNADAMVGLATVYQNRNDFQSARENFLKAAKLSPQNANLFYSIGALDWILAYDKTHPPTTTELALLIEEGLGSLDKAIAIDPQFDEAMTYKNLLLREKAKQATDQSEKTALLTQADEWFSKALQARQQNVQAGRQRTLPSVAGLTFPAPTPPAPPPPPPPPARAGLRGAGPTATSTPQIAPATPPGLMRIGGDVAQANLLLQTKPDYPALARAARVQDYVMLQAVIDREGKVADLKILHGHPLLNDAALDAVRQWRYKPLTLNGQPVDIITTITVNFSFQ